MKALQIGSTEALRRLHPQNVYTLKVFGRLNPQDIYISETFASLKFETITSLKI